MRAFAKITLSTGLFVLIAGCGGGGGKAPDFAKDLVPVTGTVKVDGQPMEGVMVSFKPFQGFGSDAKQRNAGGTTGPDGRFTIHTIPGGEYDAKNFPGAVPGKYNVGFSRFVLSDGSVWDGAKSKQSPMNAGAKETMPPRMVNPDTSGVLADVKSGGQPFEFEVSTK